MEVDIFTRPDAWQQSALNELSKTSNRSLILDLTGENPLDGPEILIYRPFGGFRFDRPAKVRRRQDKWTPDICIGCSSSTLFKRYEDRKKNTARVRWRNDASLDEGHHVWM